MMNDMNDKKLDLCRQKGRISYESITSYQCNLAGAKKTAERAQLCNS